MDTRTVASSVSHTHRMHRSSDVCAERFGWRFYKRQVLSRRNSEGRRRSRRILCNRQNTETETKCRRKIRLTRQSSTAGFKTGSTSTHVICLNFFGDRVQLASFSIVIVTLVNLSLDHPEYSGRRSLGLSRTENEHSSRS